MDSFFVCKTPLKQDARSSIYFPTICYKFTACTKISLTFLIAYYFHETQRWSACRGRPHFPHLLLKVDLSKFSLNKFSSLLCFPILKK